MAILPWQTAKLYGRREKKGRRRGGREGRGASKIVWEKGEAGKKERMQGSGGEQARRELEGRRVEQREERRKREGRSREEEEEAEKGGNSGSRGEQGRSRAGAGQEGGGGRRQRWKEEGRESSPNPN
jgi:hypothetical protein